MPLAVRLATANDYPALRDLVIESFEPITWQKPLDEQFGPLNGLDWRSRWDQRLTRIFEA